MILGTHWAHFFLDKVTHCPKALAFYSSFRSHIWGIYVPKYSFAFVWIGPVEKHKTFFSSSSFYIYIYIRLFFFIKIFLIYNLLSVTSFNHIVVPQYPYTSSVFVLLHHYWAVFSFQTAILLLRIDDIVSGHKKKGDEKTGGGQGAE